MWRANFLVGAKCLFFFAIFFFSIFLTMWWQWTWQHATAAALCTVVKFHIRGVYIKHKYQNKNFNTLLRVKESCSDLKKHKFEAVSVTKVWKVGYNKAKFEFMSFWFLTPPFEPLCMFLPVRGGGSAKFLPRALKSPCHVHMTQLHCLWSSILEKKCQSFFCQIILCYKLYIWKLGAYRNKVK